MPRISLGDPADLAALGVRIASEPSARQRDRDRAVRLALVGKPAGEIAEAVAR